MEAWREGKQIPARGWPKNTLSGWILRVRNLEVRV